MPILLVFALIAACLPVDWPEPPFDPPLETALSLTGGAVFFVLSLAFALRTWVIRTLRRDPSRRIEVAQVYGNWRRRLFFLNLATVAACVLVFGWGWLVRHESLLPWEDAHQYAPYGETRYEDGKMVSLKGPRAFRHAPFAELLVPLPYFVILIGCWLIYYDAERALHHALHYGSRSFWSRFSYLLHNSRQFALMVLLPVGIIVFQQTLGRFAPLTTRTDAYRIATFASVPFFLLLMPLLLKPLLGLRPMPPGPVRDRLEALAKRLNFRCADFLLWPTHGASVNAMIAGLLPRVRYVVFTDRILEELPPDELDAVFGHEIGHAKHGHIWLYSAFLIISLSVLAALVLFLAQLIDGAQSEEWVRFREQLEGKTWLALPPVALVVSYLFVVFGALSRRCERQADVFGCKAVSCGDPACAGHGEETVFPQGGNCLCPTGIRTFTRALDRVHDLNGLSHLPDRPRTLGELLRVTGAWMRHWQHGPIQRRVSYLLSLIGNPAAERRFQRRLFAFKWVLMLALVAALVALGESVGWRDLFDVM